MIQQTALQIYTASYKALPQDESFALLRKATRLDRHVLQAQPGNITAIARTCDGCGVDVSPKWYPAPTAQVPSNHNSMDIDTVAGVKVESNLTTQALCKYWCHQCFFHNAHKPTDDAMVAVDQA